MKKIKSLNLYQKSILIIMLAMTLIFAVVYSKTISKVGYRYNNTILTQTFEDGSTIYSGKIQGQQVYFTVSEDSVKYQCGSKTYGPYTVRIDPTAVPEEEIIRENVVGIEIYDGNILLFRGGAVDLGEDYWLFDENGAFDRKIEPSLSAIYALLNDPQLIHKGDAKGWFEAVLICIVNAVSILFADELFRLFLAFQIRNTDYAEPSDLEIVGRYISWTVLAFCALLIFIMGLQ